MNTLNKLRFNNRFVEELPADTETGNFCRQVKSACYSSIKPTLVRAPELVSYSPEVAAQLGLNRQSCESEQFTRVFTGNELLPGMQPYAQCYGGHQFGVWAGQLGDGRAINLGEVIPEYGSPLTLQLKGAGLTPYSRNADGRAVLRSSVREFLCSEAMFHLGVPTTRALSLTLTGESVVRDMFYNGQPKTEPGAVVCRVAPSFTRFGSFQIFAANGEIDLMQQLLDFTLRHDFPELGAPSVETYLQWFRVVCKKTAEMIVHWQRVGFVHGVMNTDNMSILGLTIDYGPYGWLEDYNLGWTPNTTDAAERRYCFGQQPQMAHWNLGQLANAIYPLIGGVESLQEALSYYSTCLQSGMEQMMTEKLGLQNYQAKTDDPLFTELSEVLSLVETDMTIFYRALAELDCYDPALDQAQDERLLEPLIEAYYQPETFMEGFQTRIAHWVRSYRHRISQAGISNEARRASMNAVNPNYVLRNYLAQLAIDQAEQGDFSRVNELLEVLRHPYDEQPAHQHYARKRPDWARQRAGCSMLSCSS